MSVNHTYRIGGDLRTDLQINISGLDNNSRDVEQLSANLYASCSKTGQSKFTCELTIDQLAGLHAYLERYQMIKDRSLTESGEFIQIKKGQEEIVEILRRADAEQMLNALKTIVQNTLTSKDLNIILGRKDAIEEFENRLKDPNKHDEPDWQSFLEHNDWIFGYGLRYRYLSILQRESRVSNTDLDGSNGVISDFLISDNRFTKLVELKRPSTPLFKGRQNRSDSWRLSSELTDAVSQILSQKANWEIKSQTPQYTELGERIIESTHDVDCILIVGTSLEFAGDDREQCMKRKTIELFRRNLRNIDIVFYDELLERARFIVEGSNKSINLTGNKRVLKIC